MCFGRWDSSSHEIKDTEVVINTCTEMCTWGGKDYANERIKGFSDVDVFEKCLINKNSDPRMPWHDVMVKMRGAVVYDMVKHYIQTWNFLLCKNKPLDALTEKFKNLKKSYEKGENMERIKKYCQNSIQNLTQIDANAVIGFFTRSALDAEEKINCEYPKSFHHQNLGHYKRSETNLIYDEDFSFHVLKPDLKGPTEKTYGTCRCQFLRSANHWSLGLNRIENSIQQCYVELILTAKRFIYIENQYFVSGNAGNPVKNPIVEALILRIKRAAANKEPFKVMVFLPLLVDREGRPDQDKNFRLTEMWFYKTISHGQNSLMEILKADQNIKNPKDYINFYGLRNHSTMQGVPKTEQIYVHSKLMIVDDEKVVMGSANINDRSMLGSRDAEVAIVIEDTKQIPSFMAQKEVKVNEFAYNFRMRLCMEHFDLNEDLCLDPMNEEFQKIITENTKQNTEIYRNVFRVYPDDNVRKYEDLYKFINERKLSSYEALAKKIKGFSVEYPLEWLKDENFEKEKSPLPMMIYT